MKSQIDRAHSLRARSGAGLGHCRLRVGPSPVTHTGDYASIQSVGFDKFVAKILSMKRICAGFFVLSAVFCRRFFDLTDLNSHRMMTGDPAVNAWVLDWITHAIKTNPLTMLDGNTFFPYSKSIALSEHMLSLVYRRHRESFWSSLFSLLLSRRNLWTYAAAAFQADRLLVQQQA